MNLENQRKLTYVITGDINAISRKLLGDKYNQLPQEVNRTYFENLSAAVRSVIPDNIEVRSIGEEIIDESIDKTITDLMDTNPQSVCICLDRFLLTDVGNNPEYQDRFYRFGITRSLDGSKTPRLGSPSFNQQLLEISEKFINTSDRQIILVDDGKFTGSTFDYVINLLNTIGVKNDQITVVGFIGKESDDPNTKVIEPIANLYEWVDLRDYGIFGGRLICNNRTNTIALSRPYIAPWSEGESASLDNENLFKVSQKLILEQKKLVLEWEKSLGKKLKFRDLIKAGFSLPSDQNRTLYLNIDMELTTYLDKCFEKNRSVCVLDMDGTLYQLDGQNNGYSGSALEQKVNENMLKFIQERESCCLSQAQKIAQVATSDSVGASLYLSQKYGISREDYFDNVWDIDPKEIIKNYEFALQSLKYVSKEIKLILLTSSPKIWANRVLEFLGVKDKFEQVITGEQYQFKSEIFERLSRVYIPQNIMSIGDQFSTDIKPAQNFGFKTLLIQNPEDILKISTNL